VAVIGDAQLREGTGFVDVLDDTGDSNSL
jgi:hypothetical protein